MCFGIPGVYNTSSAYNFNEAPDNIPMCHGSSFSMMYISEAGHNSATVVDFHSLMFTS